jgi:Protein of unknown function (DUF3168)
MAIPLSQIQTAAVIRAKADTGIQVAMTGASAPNWNIYDNVPTLQSFPYFYVGNQTLKQGTALTMDHNAHDIFLQFEIFSQYPGMKELQGIVNAIDAAFNQKPLTLSGGFNNFYLLFDNYVEVTESDGITRHGSLRYLLMTQGG